MLSPATRPHPTFHRRAHLAFSHYCNFNLHSEDTHQQPQTMSDSEERETKPFKFVTAGFDARFPNMNQTKHCWQNYVDYHKCINVKGEDFAPCKQFYYAYRSLCPNSWLERWDTQRENGNFPARLDA